MRSPSVYYEQYLWQLLLILHYFRCITTGISRTFLLHLVRAVTVNIWMTAYWVQLFSYRAVFLGMLGMVGMR